MWTLSPSDARSDAGAGRHTPPVETNGLLRAILRSPLDAETVDDDLISITDITD
jgi:hypothetical protein